MKLSVLITKLLKLQAQLDSDPEVIIDWDENGWHDLERVKLIQEEDELYVNLKSSNVT